MPRNSLIRSSELYYYGSRVTLPPQHYALPPAADHPIFRMVFDYWAARTEAGRLPGRQHIDPIELKSILPNLMLIDVERTGGRLRFKFRLIGTAITEANGRDVTGRYFDEIGNFPGPVERMTRVVETAQPIYAMDVAGPADRSHITLRRLSLPLASDGKIVDMIFGCCVVETHPNGRAGLQAPGGIAPV
jgi:hypothetical protein